MRKYVITTESNSDLPKDYILENNIGIIPHYYSIEDKVYGDGEELSTQEFYNEMRAGKRAATMASNPAVIEEMFERYANEGYDILHISFSSELSGGCSNVVAGGRDICEKYKDRKVIVIDSLSASLGEGLLIRKAVQMQNKGYTIEDTAKWLEENKKYVCVQFTVDDLNHLFRGGRIKKTSAILGTIMNVKPILYINEEGKLLPLLNVRGRRKSLATLADNMVKQISDYKGEQDVIGIVHGDATEEAEYLASLVKEKTGFSNVLVQPIGPSIGAHSGPGAIGLVYMGTRR